MEKHEINIPLAPYGGLASSGGFIRICYPSNFMQDDFPLVFRITLDVDDRAKRQRHIGTNLSIPEAMSLAAALLKAVNDTRAMRLGGGE